MRQYPLASKIQRKGSRNHETLKDDALLAQFILAQDEDSIKSYKGFLARNGRKHRLKAQAIQSTLELYRKKNTALGYNQFVRQYPRTSQTLQAIALSYNLYREADIIPGYRKFIKDYPNTLEAVNAMEQIHRLAFARAKAEEGYVMLEEFQRTFPYAKQYEAAGKLAYERELKEMQAKVKQRGGDFKAAERVARLERVRAQQSEEAGDHWIAARRYKLILREEPFNETDAALSVTEKREANKNHQSMLAALGKVQNNIAQLNRSVNQRMQALARTVSSGFSDLSYATGGIANAIHSQTRQMEMASDQASRRSAEAQRAQINFIRHRDDVRACKAKSGDGFFGSFFCGSY